MIVAMKKVAIIVESKDADSVLERVRTLGVLHVEHQQIPSGSGLLRLQDDIGLIQKAIDILSREEFTPQDNSVVTQEFSDGRDIARHIVDLDKRRRQLEEYSISLVQRIDQWQVWGDFDPGLIRNLAAKNIYLGFYRIPAKEINNLPKGVVVKEIFRTGGIIHCVLISQGEPVIAFPEIELPKMGLGEMRARLSLNQRAIESIKKDICKLSVRRENFARLKSRLAKSIEFHQTLKGMGQSGSLNYLVGYIPCDAAERLLLVARREKWAILINDPSQDDVVPTLVRNPRWISIINPIFKLLGIVPGYRELDISPAFLCFLSLFFGMIIGDAGYGIVYILLTFWLAKKFSKKIKDQRIFLLFYVFSACAVFWGLLTGTVFGQEWYIKAGFRPIVPLLNNTKFLQAFCFFLGALHLTLAHTWQAIRKMPSLSSLADTGWIFVLWAAFFLARNLILDDPLPFFEKWLILIGLSLVIFFASPQRNILKMIGAGLGTVALSLMNNFTDVVSYVRLFAVGLAGVAIADTVNTLAAGFSGNPLLAGVIVFIGHTINIIIGPMSVLVHGIRLNVLEFSSHANLGWSGFVYKPLE